jgi:hypothetical protein
MFDFKLWFFDGRLKFTEFSISGGGEGFFFGKKVKQAAKVGYEEVQTFHVFIRTVMGTREILCSILRAYFFGMLQTTCSKIRENSVENLMEIHGKYFRKKIEGHFNEKGIKKIHPHSKFQRREKISVNFPPKFHIENFPKLNSGKQVNIERGMYN